MAEQVGIDAWVLLFFCCWVGSFLLLLLGWYIKQYSCNTCTTYTHTHTHTHTKHTHQTHTHTKHTHRHTHTHTHTAVVTSSCPSAMVLGKQSFSHCAVHSCCLCTGNLMTGLCPGEAAVRSGSGVTTTGVSWEEWRGRRSSYPSAVSRWPVCDRCSSLAESRRCLL